MLSFKEIARYAEESSVEVVPTSLVTGVKDNAHKIGLKKRGSCPNRLIFQEIAGDGNWRWTAAPCDSWTCQPCYEWRVETELIPEIVEALEWAKELGQTLKFLTLSYQSEDLGAQNTLKGRERRREDIAHFFQGLRRKGYRVEYLKVVEAHKSGKIHLHFLLMADYLDQGMLSKLWQIYTRGSSRVVDIRAVGQKCPRCYPGPKASEKEKRQSTIVPPPGKGECLCCGYRPDWDSYDVGMAVASDIAKEVAKYLSKEMDSAPVKSRVKKLSRSKGWSTRCVQKKKREEELLCDVCESVHRRVYAGKVETLIREGFKGVEEVAKEYQIAFYPQGGRPSLCWGESITWVESAGKNWDFGLRDYVELGVGGGDLSLQGQLGLEGLSIGGEGGGGGESFEVPSIAQGQFL